MLESLAEMRFFAIVPILCAVVAFILSFLLVFAGHKPNFLEHYDLLTVCALCSLLHEKKSH